MEDSIRIDGESNRHFIFVDQFDDDVWISLNVPGGRTHMTLTHNQTKELIAALEKALEVANA
jgi:hypothetical protein